MSTKPLVFSVAFDDADMEGIVFFGNYFRMAHRALEQFFPQIGIAWEEWFKNPDFGVPLRQVEADYRRPLRPGETFQIRIRVAHLGESSVRFEYDFITPDGAPIATLKTSHVFVTRAGEMKKLALPASIRERLEKHLVD